MKTIIPKPLKKGDTIAFIAPAGPIKDRTAIERAKSFLEISGYNVIYSKHLFNQTKYFSDTDENRLEDLHWAFSDNDIDAIICARGGYGCLRLINSINYELIKNNPKILCGYSDITVLSAMILKRTGLITYSGAMARSDFGKEKPSEYTIENFFKTIEQNTNIIYCGDKIYHSGEATGILFGGNLASIVTLCGIDFLPENDFIFFTEDLNEPVYKIDRMFTQLMNISDFKKHVKGIVVGEFIDNGYPEQLDELFTNIGAELNIPVIGGFKISHGDDKITLPYGLKAKLNNNELRYIW